MPFSHVYGQVANLISVLLSGGGIILPGRFSARSFWLTLAKYRATWFSGVPAIYSILLCRSPEEFENLDLSSLQFGRSASAPLPVSVQKAFEDRFQVPIVETYGLTETTSQVTTNPRIVNQRKIGSVGKQQGCEVKIVNKAGRELASGQQGEIVVKGANVMKGYYKDPKATAAALRDGWFHTEDLGFKDDQGFLFITGRSKELINRGGENIQPREINEILFNHPKILEAATAGIPDPVFTEEVKSFVVFKRGQECSEDELIDYCRQYLAEFKCPKSISVLEAMPKSPGGKIIHRRLLELS